MCPWWLYGESIFTWLIGYSALLGPIAGVMICDFWVLRRKQLAVDELYMMDGRYTYGSGTNRWAVWALIIGVLPNLPGFLLQISATSALPVDKLIAATRIEDGRAWMQTANDVYQYAWMVGFVVAFVAYYVLMSAFDSSFRADQQA
jgi:nucleobase:cation symporter-1, NCS1 family